MKLRLHSQIANLQSFKLTIGKKINDQKSSADGNN